MQIIGRIPNPDDYSIRDIQLYPLEKERDGAHVTRFDFCLSVSLKPTWYQRVDGTSGVKKNPCKLKIEFSELQQMLDAVTRELGACYRVLNENGLLENLAKAKKESGAVAS